jgi:enoyl-CoA hydratase/carnithine racemase
MSDLVESASVETSYPRPGVALICNKAEPLGVLRLSVKRALLEELKRLEKDPHVRCLVLTGSGRSFSVGSDIREFQQDPAWLLLSEQIETGLNRAIEDSPLPVIAACNGHTLGGGAVLALACDLRLAGASARFGFPEVNVGAFASGSGTQRLPRLIGPGRALHLLLTGRIVDAAEAERIGLVDAVVADAELLGRALDLAEEIARKSPAALTASKRCVVEGLRHGEAAGLALELELSVATGLSAEAIEGQRAFVEKRPPRFKPATTGGEKPSC